MKFRLLFIGSFILSGILFFYSCASDKLPDASEILCVSSVPVTYDNQVATIINVSCAYAGCHDGVSGAPGDYNSYSGLADIITDGSFVSRTFTFREDPSVGMPPNNASGPIDLSQAELELLQCWVDAGFPEN